MYLNFMFLDQFLSYRANIHTHGNTHTHTHTGAHKDSDEYSIVVFLQNETIKTVQHFKIVRCRLIFQHVLVFMVHLYCCYVCCLPQTIILVYMFMLNESALLLVKKELQIT